MPAAFIYLTTLPLTPNGKVDRRALPAPQLYGSEPERAGVAPRTPVEKIVAGLWADILHLEHVNLHDDFFALGGHSLLATQLISRLRLALQVDLPVRVLFEAPTVAELAVAIVQYQTAQWPQERDSPPLGRGGRDLGGGSLRACLKSCLGSATEVMLALRFRATVGQKRNRPREANSSHDCQRCVPSPPLQPSAGGPSPTPSPQGRPPGGPRWRGRRCRAGALGALQVAGSGRQGGRSRRWKSPFDFPIRRWCWTCGSGWGRVASQGCPGGTASGRGGEQWAAVRAGQQQVAEGVT